MLPKIYSYKMGSKSAKSLANELGTKLLKHEGKTVHAPVINWGASRIDRKIEGGIMNHPDAVAIAVNKLKTFKAIDVECDIPPWTDNIDEAYALLGQGFTIVARTKLTGHSGEGIVLVEPGGELPVAPLYTGYIKKKNEWRIHVMNGEVFFVQKKLRKIDVPDDQVNWKIRNHKNGFIYAHNNVDVQEVAKTSAIRAINAIGLDFGAVDIIETAKEEFFVLEVNTACGLEGTTLKKYAEQFRKYYE